ncbi:hypothetical protein GCM10022206_31980 [Streptomyces chiangmaiensis]
MQTPTHLAAGLRLPTNGLDHTILGIYFVVVLGIGFAARRSVRTSLDFFLSRRSLPAWITGLAFNSANLAATEILGMAANSAQYGAYTVHWYWIGAIPAMVFLGLVMMPFYYGSKVRSVPEFLLLRFDKAAHLLSSILFAFAAILIAGVNLYALAIVVEALLGWPQWVAIVVAGFFVLAYITLGGLSSAIYNEVLQFFVILAALIPITVLGLKKVGGWGGLTDKLTAAHGHEFVTAWGGTGIGHTNPLGANWLTIVLVPSGARGTARPAADGPREHETCGYGYCGDGSLRGGAALSSGPARSSRPVRAARAAASRREPTPSFIRTRWTWVRAVDGAMPMPAAISRVSSPSATRTRTSTSRGVSICSRRWPSSSGWAAGLSSSLKAPCNSCGATTASPARAFMIARSTPSMRSSCRT